MKPKIFVIILNWNRFDDTLETLESIDKLNASDFELHTVVIDNASSDGSVEKLKKEKFDNIKVEFVLNNENLGFAAGNNRGIDFALKNGADYLCILNNDVIVDPDLITSLLVQLQGDDTTGAISPKMYFAKGFEYRDKYKKSDLGKVIWYAGGIIDWNNVYGVTRGVDQVDEGQFNQTCETDFTTGTCLFTKTEVIKKMKGFDEKFFMYYEDTDLSVRIKLAGLKLIYEPKAILWHKVSQSSGIGGNLNDYFISRNRLLFGMRYASNRTKFALFRESVKLLFLGRPWQKIGIRDFYLGNFGKGSWK